MEGMLCHGGKTARNNRETTETFHREWNCEKHQRVPPILVVPAAVAGLPCQTTSKALFVLTANWLIGLLELGYSLLIVERAGHEEQMLIERFGDEYRAYMQRTGRFLPRRGRTTADAGDKSPPSDSTRRTALTVRRRKIWKVSPSAEPSSLSY